MAVLLPYLKKRFSGSVECGEPRGATADKQVWT